MKILFTHVLPITDPENYKLHCAVYNGRAQPLDEFVESRALWDKWTRYKGKRNRFNRKTVLSLIRFYPEEHVWLFGGIYNVSGFNDQGYLIERNPYGEALVGRLKINFKLSGRNTEPNLENQLPRLEVRELLRESYSGNEFPGFDNIQISFRELENIIKIQSARWQTALQNMKGVYLITDTSNGKLYVGKASAGKGIWSRWSDYIKTGHGGNIELKKQLEAHDGIDYARNNFSFALLEYAPMRADDSYLDQREKYWKDLLLSRSRYGYNKN